MSALVSVPADIEVEYLSRYDKSWPTLGAQRPGDAGFDLRAAQHEATGPITLLPGERRLIPTGVRVALPTGYEMQIRPRSGLALNSGVTVLNAPGTIDSGFRGEVGIVLVNHDNKLFVVRRGDRVAQGVIAKLAEYTIRSATSLGETERGEGGFGSSGVSL